MRRTVGSRDKRYGFIEELDALRREFLLPDDAPKPEDVIRKARDERARELHRRARGL